MRKTILFIATSLDGFIAKPDGNIDWLFSDQDYGYKEFYEGIDTVLMGRKTYDLCMSFEEYPYKDKMAYVFTKTPKEDSENIQFIADPSSFVRELKEQNGKDIWVCGGGEIASLLTKEGLCDEIVVSVHPIVLGNGIPLFKNISESVKLEFVDGKNFETGLVQMKYKVLR